MKGSFGVVCLTCGSGLGSNTASGSVDSAGTSADWAVLDVADHPFSIRYRSGNREDAEQVSEWATYAYRQMQRVYYHEIETPFTFDLYPAAEWGESHNTMVYRENDLSVELVTPSEYDGSYDDLDLYYRHGVVHEYVHAVQNDAMSFHTHANWLMEGLAEAVAVYHTNDDIYRSYYENHHRARSTREDIRRGYGYLLGVNEYVYRGSMHLLQFMIEKYGGQAVGEIYEQDAESAIEAVESSLGVSPLDLEAEWLKYAQREFGGDYTDDIERLGGTVEGRIAIAGYDVDGDGAIRIETARYEHDDFVVVFTDGDGSMLGVSDEYAGGSRVSDTSIPLEPVPDTPSAITATVHRAGDDGYGDPVTLVGSRVSDTVLYRTEASTIGFADAPAAGDAAVTVHGFVAEEYDGGDKLKLNVYDGDATNSGARINESYGHTVSRGEQFVNYEIILDESLPGVPLDDGQTVTAAVVDLDNDEAIAKAGSTVGNDGSDPTDTPTSTETTARQSDDATATESGGTETPTGGTETPGGSTATADPTDAPSATDPTADATATATVAGTATASAEGGTATASAGEADDGSTPQDSSPGESDPDESTSGSGPGFGVVAALSGIGYGVYRRVRRE